MSRIIKPSEITPGAFIRFTEGGFIVQTRVSRVERKSPGDAYRVWSNGERYVLIDARTPVEVFEEQQPEEPTAFGACVEAAGRKYVRADNGDGIAWSQATPNGYDWFDWEDICGTGHVTVVNSDPFNHGD